MIAQEGTREALIEPQAPCPETMSRIRVRVDTRLTELCPRGERSAQLVADAMAYSLLAGGKRLRPVLAVLTAQSLGAESDAALDPACALEMVHTASLILDDLPCMDDAAMRRGRPANHRVYGEAVASLAAVALISAAFGVIACCDEVQPAVRAELTRMLSDAIGLEGLTGGQACDLQGVASQDVGELERMESQKTGTLFETSVRIGARVAGADGRAVDAVCRYARHAGRAYQIFDDLLDRYADHERIGKDVQQDMVKVTYGNMLSRAAAEAMALESCAHAERALRNFPGERNVLAGFLEVMIDGYRNASRTAP